MNKLPLKIGILRTITRRGPVSASGVFDALEKEYGRERQFTVRSVTNHILSLCGVNYVAEEQVKDGESPQYIVKDAGKAALKSALGKREI